MAAKPWQALMTVFYTDWGVLDLLWLCRHTGLLMLLEFFMLTTLCRQAQLSCLECFEPDVPPKGALAGQSSDTRVLISADPLDLSVLVSNAIGSRELAEGWNLRQFLQDF